MAALHLLDYADKDFISLCSPCLFFLYSGLIKKVKIFQSLMELDYPINSYEGRRVSLPAGIGIGKRRWVSLRWLLRIG